MTYARQTAAAALFVGILFGGSCARSLQQQIEHAKPGKYLFPEQESARCVAGVQHLEQHAGIPVYRANIQHLGQTDGQAIWLQHGMTPCSELETLAHEIAHLYQPPGLTMREAQLFCDVVSIGVVRRLAGYDPTSRYLPYMAPYKMDSRLLSVYRREIETVVSAMTKGGK